MTATRVNRGISCMMINAETLVRKSTSGWAPYVGDAITNAKLVLGRVIIV